MNFSSNKAVKVLTPKDFKPNTFDLKDSKMCGLLLFYSPQCGHCVAMHPTYVKVAEKAAFANICAINCLENRDFIVNSMNSSSGFLNGYPTIYLYSGGKPIKQYDGKRDVDSIIGKLMDLKCSI